MRSSNEIPPTVSGLVPQTGPTAGGNVVTLYGTHLDGATVRVNGVQATVLSQTATQAVFLMVPGEGSTTVNADNNVTASGGLTYTYAAPTISSIQFATIPSSGAAITIAGNNFGLNPSVTVGAVPAPIISHTHTQIVALAPGGTPGQVANVQVTVAGVTSNTAPITYVFVADEPPAISSMKPQLGPTAGGSTVTVIGTQFDYATHVVFNGVMIQPTVLSTTLATFITPPGQGVVQVVIGNSLGAMGPQTYAYALPNIASITPASGPAAGGNTITLTGTNFGLTPSVRFSGNTAPIISQSHTQIVATVPSGTPGQAVDVSIQFPGGGSNTVKYTYSAPTITSIAPSSAPTSGGQQITLTGTDFGSTAPTVTFNGTSASVVSASQSQIVFTLPKGEGKNLPVAITTGEGATSNTITFSYNPPSVGYIGPVAGPVTGGNTILISGTSFSPSATVKVGGVPAVVQGATYSGISIIAPPGPVGPAPVVVTVAGQSSDGHVVYTYQGVPPTITNIAPATGPTAGGTPVTIAGSNFGSAATVTVGGASASVLSANNTQVVFMLPAGEGTAAVVATAGGLTSNAVNFTYNAPTIAGLSPASGPVAGGTRVTINGANFGLRPTVTFGSAMVPLVSSTHSQIVVNTPASAPTSVPVIVTVGGKASNAASYLYVCPDGTVISNGACVTPVVALGNVVASLPTEAQGQLAPIVAEITSKLTDNNPNNDNGACGQLNAVSKQTAALLKTGKISSSDAAAVNSAIALVSSKAGCK